ncbi:MAG: S8 family serine peptidase, partial [Verrucomicrobia bacterium]|nr:S8 family serine peptidase [Verrucomicrobiota bacterium]
MRFYSRHKWSFGFLFFLCAAVGLTQGLQAGDKEPGPFELTANGGLYTFHAKDARVADVLGQLKRMDVVDLQVDPNMSGTVTADLEGVALEDVLKTLTKSQAFVYEKVGDSYKLVEATVTSQQDPVAVARPAREEAAFVPPPGVLANTKRSPVALREDMAHAILLENAIIDTAAARAGKSIDIPEAFRASPDTAYYIVQFDHAVAAADRALLEGVGAVVSHYVPNSAYAVHLGPGELDAVRNLPGVQYIEPYHPYFKMSADIRDTLVGTPSDLSKARADSGHYNVMTFRGVDDVTKDIEKAGGQVTRVQSVDGRQVVSVECDPSALQALLAQDSVQWVEPVVERKPMNDLANRRIRATSFKTLHPTLKGDGVVINVTDSGIDFTNPGYAINPNLPTSTNINTRIAYYEARPSSLSDGVPGDMNGHGTHVSGSILGNGALSSTVVASPGSGSGPYGASTFAGIAPNATVVMLEDFISFTDAEQAEVAYKKGARISNNSWGDSLFQYGAFSAIWDALVRDADSTTVGDQQYIALFAAGNEGDGNDDGTGGTPSTVGQPGNAKNVITVGAVEQARLANNLLSLGINETDTDTDWQIASYSSRGPVQSTDVRLKPDIVAPGSYVLSIQSHETLTDDLLEPFLPHRDYRAGNVNSGTNFAFLSGTSMATPVSAGGAALIYQHFTNTYGFAPSPAMMKATMVVGARMVNSIIYKLPIQFLLGVVDQGWGLLDVERSVDGPRIQATDEVTPLDEDDTTPLQTGNAYTRQITVGPGEGGLKIALAWTDVAGTPGNSAQLVNNLDLRVFGPGGARYLGNYFDLDGINSRNIVQDGVTTNSGDIFNNVELVVLGNATPGTYSIQVVGREVPSGPQNFALAIQKGIALEGRTEGDNPAIALHTNDLPIIAFADLDDAGHKQIYVKYWAGPYGDLSELGQWKRLDDQWFGIRESARLTGISQSLEDSSDPAIATHGQQIFVPWVHESQDTSQPDRIYFKQYTGSEWVEAFNSAHDNGISGVQTYDASEPAVAVARNTGYPVVAWRQKVLTGSRINVALRGDSTWFGLGGSETGGVTGGSVAINPDVCVDSSGFPVVAWEEQTTQRIAVRRWNGSSWADLGNQGNAPYAGSPKLANGPNGEIYLTWVQTPNGVGSNFYYQIFVSRWQGGVWSALAGSTNFQGISLSTNNNTRPYAPAIAVGINGQLLVSWQATTNANNSILFRKFNGTSWTGISGSEAPPGIATIGGVSTKPAIAGDTKGLPIVVYQNTGAGQNEVVTYTV